MSPSSPRVADNLVSPAARVRLTGTCRNKIQLEVETKKRTKLEADYAEAAGKVTLLESAVKNLTFQKESLAVSPPPTWPRNKNPPPLFWFRCSPRFIHAR